MKTLASNLARRTLSFVDVVGAVCAIVLMVEYLRNGGL